MPTFNPQYFFASLLVLFFGIGLHEYAHCKFADLAGDPTPRYYGRVTLNLFKHFDPMGAIMIVFTSYIGFGIGWGKPSPMDASKMQNPRWDFFIAVIAGPLSNVVQATLYMAILKGLIIFHAMAYVPNFVQLFLILGAIINLCLCLFNLIPLGPLDGHWLVGSFLPEKQRNQWYQFNRSYGYFALMIVVFGGQFFARAGGESPLSFLVSRPAIAIVRRLVPELNLGE